MILRVLVHKERDDWGGVVVRRGEGVGAGCLLCISG